MTKKMHILSFVTLLSMIFNVAAVTAIPQTQDKERLDAIYQAYNSNELNVATAKEDSELLQAHIDTLLIERESLNSFGPRVLKPELFNVGKYGTAFVFQYLMRFFLSESGRKEFSEIAKVVLEGNKEVKYEIGRKIQFGIRQISFSKVFSELKALPLDERCIGAAIVVGAPLLTILAGIGTVRMFTWAYQYNQNREKRLVEIEENIKLDEAIIAQLKSA